MCGKMKERMIALLVKGMIGGRSEVAREKEGGRAHYWNKSRSTNESINNKIYKKRMRHVGVPMLLVGGAFKVHQ